MPLCKPNTQRHGLERDTSSILATPNYKGTSWQWAAGELLGVQMSGVGMVDDRPVCMGLGRGERRNGNVTGKCVNHNDASGVVLSAVEFIEEIDYRFSSVTTGERLSVTWSSSTTHQGTGVRAQELLLFVNIGTRKILVILSQCITGGILARSRDCSEPAGLAYSFPFVNRVLTPRLIK